MIGRKGPPSAGEAKPKGFDAFDTRLGDLMRGERATLGKSLLDVQRELKIKASYIAAIENADPDAFETPGFIAGYVRSYARYLGMDPEWAFARFCAESNFEVAHGMSAAASGQRTPGARKAVEYREPLANPNASFVPRSEGFLARIEPQAIGSMMVLVLLIGGIGFGGWKVLQEVQKVQLAPVDQAPTVVTDLDPVPQPGEASGPQMAAVAPDTAETPAGVPVPEALDRLYRPQALDVPVLVARDGPIAAIDPHSVGALADAGHPSAAAAVEEAVIAALVEPTVRTVAPDAPDVELIAVRPSWVRVQAADGTVIFEKILDAGERYALPKTEEPPLLRSGNSGSVYFAVNGETYGPAAPGAQVVKNVVLSPDALRDKYQVADLAQDPDLAKIVAVADATPVVQPASE